MLHAVQREKLDTGSEGSAPALLYELPALAPGALAVESIRLETLVHHREQIDAECPLEEAQRAFRQRRVGFVAVQRQGRVIGLCSRGQIGFVMSARFGFALYSQTPVEHWMVETPLIVEHTTPVRALLARALARCGDAFFEDVVLVDAGRRLIGLVKAESLAQLQSRLVAEQLAELRTQNVELFRTRHEAWQSTSLYTSLFDNHALGVALLDGRGVIHEHNQRLRELLNCGDAPSAVVSLTGWVAEHERARFLEFLAAHIDGRTRAATRELAIQVPGRGLRLFRCSTGWVHETGQICACLEDLTEQRALEQSALRHEKQSQLDTLVGGIAHELNNKLTPVLGYAELLCAEGHVNPDYIEVIQHSVGEASRIVRQLLELSRPPTHEPGWLDLRQVIEETVVMLKFQVQELECGMQSNLPAEAVWVHADRAHLKQVVLNLAMNALHAVEGRPDALLSLAVQRVNERALLLVADNGCGIPRENLGRIFDPFFTTKDPSRGTGLGLSICASLVRQNGGEIMVESVVGEGSRFTVSLPAREPAPACIAEPAPRPASLTFAPEPGRRVLVVEDEVVLRRLMQQLLFRHCGCTVDLAKDGREALSFLAENDYALVISDVRMPGMDGIEFFLRLRESRPDQIARLVFVTGYPDRGLQHPEIRRANVPVVAKPFTTAGLLEVCRPVLERWTQTATAPGAEGPARLAK